MLPSHVPRTAKPGLAFALRQHLPQFRSEMRIALVTTLRAARRRVFCAHGEHGTLCQADYFSRDTSSDEPRCTSTTMGPHNDEFGLMLGCLLQDSGRNRTFHEIHRDVNPRHRLTISD